MRLFTFAGRRRVAALLGCVFALLLAACEKPDPLQATRLLVFGTVVDVATWGVTPKPAQAAFDELRTAFESWHREWHAWEDSPLSRANRAFAAGAGAALTPDLLRLVSDARAWSQASNGLFDPAIGRLVALWGFNQGERPDAPPPPPKASGRPRERSCWPIRAASTKRKGDWPRPNNERPTCWLSATGCVRTRRPRAVAGPSIASAAPPTSAR